MIRDEILNQLRIAPGTRVRLGDFDPGWAQTDELRELGKGAVRERAAAILEKNTGELAEAQELLWASATRGVLIILQGIDASGKDGTIKHVMRGVNPQGCRVVSFKVPTEAERRRPFLWRHMNAVPARGEIVIFNRSHYEETLIVRVHPHLLDPAVYPADSINETFWKQRYEDINAFEHHLARNGTLILKFYLNISRDEQKKRFIKRLEDPEKHWKFSTSDVAEREHWEAYRRAFEDSISATSTDWAPWHIIPADQKWVARALVAEYITSAIRKLKLRYPTVSDDEHESLNQALRKLRDES